MLTAFPMHATRPAPAGAPPRLRVGLTVWAAGMTGAVAMAAYLPNLLAAFGGDPLELPRWLPAAAAAQSGVLLAVGAALGAALAPALDLHAPAAEALAARRPVGPALRPQWVPGLAGAALGTALLLVAGAAAPDAVAALEGEYDPPLWVRVLYGGITEEVLLRWGMMTALVWVGWRFVQRRGGRPGPGIVWAAIVGSSLLFGAGHLPTAALLVGSLSLPVVVYVVFVNAAFGLVAGWLYWRIGLEAAVLAHIGTHVGVAVATAIF